MNRHPLFYAGIIMFLIGIVAGPLLVHHIADLVPTKSSMPSSTEIEVVYCATLALTFGITPVVLLVRARRHNVKLSRNEQLSGLQRFLSSLMIIVSIPLLLVYGLIFLLFTLQMIFI